MVTGWSVCINFAIDLQAIQKKTLNIIAHKMLSYDMVENVSMSEKSACES